jgi:hypothetical protein
VCGGGVGAQNGGYAGRLTKKTTFSMLLCLIVPPTECPLVGGLRFIYLSPAPPPWITRCRSTRAPPFLISINPERAALWPGGGDSGEGRGLHFLPMSLRIKN